MENILSKIRAERQKQDAKWGVQNHDLPLWCTIMTEEVGEVANACLEARHSKDYSKVEEELVQVAAVAVAMLEYLDRKKQAKTIILNGRSITFDKPSNLISYEDIVTLSYPRYELHEMPLMTIVYDTRDDSKSGSLTPGQSTEVVNGMIISCMNTSNA